MQFDATMTRPSGRLPGSPWESVRNSLQFEGVTATFHCTSPFFIFARFTLNARGFAGSALRPEFTAL